MPAPERTNRYQTALLWEADGNDAYGSPKVSALRAIKVRWIQKRSQTTDPQGNSIALDATVIVGQKIAPGSAMWLGTQADWLGTGSGSGLDDSEVMEVKTYDETPDLKGRLAQRTVGLARYKDTIPNLS